tara:strand:+ start:211 stop:399 length:189 start_codon:yes stop_codon:yes gene_type:complete
MEWQPIETAPKDKTQVLVWRQYEYSYDHLLFGIDWFEGGEWQKSRKYMQPTHWMPLPEPPKE